MKIETFVVGQLQNNCYVIYDENTREALVVDPGDEPDRIQDFMKETNLTVKYIVCTHAHFDHIGALMEIKESTEAGIVIHRDDLPIYSSAQQHAAMWGFQIDPLPEPEVFVTEGDVLTLGRLKFQVMHTPGHSPGGICLFGEGILITGDTVFAGSVGRTDLPGGNIRELKKSFARLMDLPPSTQILPGHGPSSTIQREQAMNFFIHEI